MAPAQTEEIAAFLKEYSAWTHEEDKLVRHVVCADFVEALGLLVRIGVAAEKVDHHPELFNVYNRVTIGLCTHDAGDVVTEKDLSLATTLEGLIP